MEGQWEYVEKAVKNQGPDAGVKSIFCNIFFHGGFRYI